MQQKSIKELEHEREQANNLDPVIASEIASVQQDVQATAAPAYLKDIWQFDNVSWC